MPDWVIRRRFSYMFELVSKEETKKIVVRMIGELSRKITYYQLSIFLNVSEKTIYKWYHGVIPKADNYLSLQSLHKFLVK